MLVYLIPLIAIMLPAMRFLPELIAYRPKSRIAALYAKLLALEREIVATPDGDQIPHYVQRLDAIEDEVTDAKVPGWYAQDVYALRAAIDLVRERLGAEREGHSRLPSVTLRRPRRKRPSSDARQPRRPCSRYWSAWLRGRRGLR